MEDADPFVLGLDLDGCVADFYGRMREIYAEWSERDESELDPEPTWGFPEWGLVDGEYDAVHHFAVSQRELFSKMKPLPGAPSALRRLSTEGVHIRVATHRLFVPRFHEIAAMQTIRWLDHHGIPYRDLCLIRDKTAVRADLFVEDSEANIKKLTNFKIETICISNSTNTHFNPPVRANDWKEAEDLIRARYYQWRSERGLRLPAAPGMAPPKD